MDTPWACSPSAREDRSSWLTQVDYLGMCRRKPQTPVGGGGLPLVWGGVLLESRPGRQSQNCEVFSLFQSLSPHAHTTAWAPRAPPDHVLEFLWGFPPTCLPPASPPDIQSVVQKFTPLPPK